jgi:hypothetical protein
MALRATQGDENPAAAQLSALMVVPGTEVTPPIEMVTGLSPARSRELRTPVATIVDGELVWQRQ